LPMNRVRYLFLVFGVGGIFVVGAFFVDWIAPHIDKQGMSPGGGLIYFLFGIIIFYNIIRNLRNRRAIWATTERAMPRDGKVFAAVGTIRALRDPIEAPFSQRRCVIFEYEIYRSEWVHRGREHENRAERDQWVEVEVLSCKGIRMTPCAVRTSVGDITFVGYPRLDGFHAENVSEIAAHVEEFLSNTSFKNFTWFAQPRGWAESLAASHSDDGIIEQHHRMVADIDPQGRMIQETCVLINEPVCAIGHFSKKRGGFIQNVGYGWRTRLYKGTPDTLISRISKEIDFFLFAGSFCCIIGIIHVLFVLYAK
jgi:hypothetical protein